MYLFLGFNGEIACKNSFDFQCIEISSIFVREKVCIKYALEVQRQLS